MYKIIYIITFYYWLIMISPLRFLVEKTNSSIAFFGLSLIGFYLFLTTLSSALLLSLLLILGFELSPFIFSSLIIGVGFFHLFFLSLPLQWLSGFKKFFQIRNNDSREAQQQLNSVVEKINNERSFSPLFRFLEELEEE